VLVGRVGIVGFESTSLHEVQSYWRIRKIFYLIPFREPLGAGLTALDHRAILPPDRGYKLLEKAGQPTAKDNQSQSISHCKWGK
jgi:hypothetical protein